MVRWLGRALAVAVVLLAAILLLLAFLPGEWLAQRVADVASKRLEAQVDIAQMRVEPFSLTPLVELNGVVIQEGRGPRVVRVDSAQASIKLSDLLQGNAVIDRVQINGGSVLVDAQDVKAFGLPFLLDLTPGPGFFLDKTARKVPDLRIRDILVDAVTLHGPDDSNASGLDLRLSGATSTDDSGAGTRVQIDGNYFGRPLMMTAELPGMYYWLNGFPAETAAQDIQLSVELGNSHLDVTGGIGNPSEWQDVSLLYSLGIVSNEDWQVMVPDTRDELPPLSLSGDLMRGREDWLLRNLSWQWGQSDLSGDLRVNTDTKPFSIDARLISKELHREDVSVLLPPGHAIEDFIPTDLSELVSVVPQLLQHAASVGPSVQGSISHRVERVVAEGWPLTMIDLLLEMKSGQQMLTINRLALTGGGVLEGQLEVGSVDGATETSLDLYLKRFALTNKTQADETSGRLAAHLGVRLRNEAGSTELSVQDGHVVALAAGGDVSVVLAGLMGVDEPSSMFSAAEQPGSSRVKCSFADLQLREDGLDIATLVASTTDAIVLGDGSLSWHEGALDAALESHSTKEPGTSAVAAWHVGGLLAAPVREVSSPVLSRDTALSMLSDIILPAARLMPYLESGLDAKYSAFCSGMANALQGVQ